MCRLQNIAMRYYQESVTTGQTHTQTDGETDAGQSDPYLPLRFAGDTITRAPRGTDRSPVYNEYFCYKLDSRVKNLTKEWNEKQEHFITHASRSLLWIQFVAIAFRSEEENFWRGPPVTYFDSPGSAPGQIWPKHLYACARPWALHPYQVS